MINKIIGLLTKDSNNEILHQFWQSFRDWYGCVAHLFISVFQYRLNLLLAKKSKNKRLLLVIENLTSVDGSVSHFKFYLV